LNEIHKLRPDVGDGFGFPDVPDLVLCEGWWLNSKKSRSEKPRNGRKAYLNVGGIGNRIRKKCPHEVNDINATIKAIWLLRDLKWKLTMSKENLWTTWGVPWLWRCECGGTWSSDSVPWSEAMLWDVSESLLPLVRSPESQTQQWYWGGGSSINSVGGRWEMDVHRRGVVRPDHPSWVDNNGQDPMIAEIKGE
jgi:hypothetical protein